MFVSIAFPDYFGGDYHLQFRNIVTFVESHCYLLAQYEYLIYRVLLLQEKVAGEVDAPGSEAGLHDVDGRSRTKR